MSSSIDGRRAGILDLIAELIRLEVDVIVTAGAPAALAVKRATTTIPLVMIAVGDPLGTGPKAIGLTIPQSVLLLRADKIIE